MKSRLTLPSAEAMSPRQRAIHDDILHTRKSIQGPFLAWLLSPELADPAQRLGAFCRYGTALSLDESELLILSVAAHYECVGEQQIHEPVALRAGLPQAVIDALRQRKDPPVTTARMRVLADVARELLDTRKLSDALYAHAVKTFGEPALVEIVAIIGYYALVAYTLNAFDMRVA